MRGISPIDRRIEHVQIDHMMEQSPNDLDTVDRKMDWKGGVVHVGDVLYSGVEMQA